MGFIIGLFGGAAYALLLVYLLIYWRESQYRKRRGLRMNHMEKLFMKMVAVALVCFVVFVFLIVI